MLISLIAVLVFGYVIVGIGLFLFQRNLIYFPTNRPITNGSLITLPDDKNISVLTTNTDRSNAIIYFGGNSENINYTISTYMVQFPEYAIYMMNYRGFNQSRGKPSEKNLIGDAIQLYDLVEKHHDQIYVIGRSLGSGVAVQLAAQRPIDRLVLITPFTSLQEIAQQKFKAFPVSLLLKDKYKSYHYASKIKANTLILIAKNDEIIPSSNSLKLVNYFSSARVEHKIFNNEDHNSISSNYKFFTTIQNFITEKQ